MRDVDAASRPAAADQVAARDRDPAAYNGRISAEALERAIAGHRARASTSTSSRPKPRTGCSGTAFRAPPTPPSSAPARWAISWHYEDNGRQMKAGELVVMDYGGSLDYLDDGHHADLAGVRALHRRTAARPTNACSRRRKRSSRPSGPASRETSSEDRARTSSSSDGFDPRYAYVGHYVGMSVHDVGDWTCRSRPGW